MKTAVIVLSDPTPGTEEATGRLFNALAVVHDLKGRGRDVRLQFQGTGVRWVPLLTDPTHPFHALYTGVEDKVAGISCACSDVFGAREANEKVGSTLLTDNAIPGTSGLPSWAPLIEQGYSIVTF